jgi:hypothetical protein
MFTTSWGGSRKLPFAFTEEGLAMLSKQEEPRRKIGFKTGADSWLSNFLPYRHKMRKIE